MHGTRTISIAFATALALGTASAQAQNAWHGDVDHDLAATAALTQLAAGSIPSDIETLESDLRRQSGASSYLRAITALGFRMRGTGPALTATSQDLGIQLLVYQAAHDTEGVRTTVFAIDEARAHLAQRNLPPPVDLAEAELSLGDSAAALARLRHFRATAPVMERTVSWGAVQNGWLLGRTWALLADLARGKGMSTEADSAEAMARAEGVVPDQLKAEQSALRLAPSTSNGRVRYDAILWMQPVTTLTIEAPKPTARLTFSVSEHRRAEADGGFTTTQTYDSIALDVPMLDHLGNDGLAIRRAIQASAGSLSALTRTDSLEHTTSRTLSSSALPDELKKLLEQGAGFGPLSAAAILPGHAVTAGDRWTSPIQLDVPGTADALPLNATYRLDRLVTAGNRRLAFIDIEAGGADAHAMSDGGKVQAHLTGELVRDVATGETLRLAASLRATVWTPTGSQIPVRVLLTALREGELPGQSIAMR